MALIETEFISLPSVRISEEVTLCSLKISTAFDQAVEFSFKRRLVLPHRIDGSLALKFFPRAAPEGYLLFY